MFKKVLCFIFSTFLLLSAINVHADEQKSWEDEIIYSLMVDRFNNGDYNNDFDVNLTDPNSYQGGDFKGIKDKLDYLKEMGFTSIQLSPIFDNEDGGYHGAWIKDYYNTDEHFGSIEEFKQLVDFFHKNNMRIILEFPIQKEMGTDEIIDVVKWWINETKIDGFKMTNINAKPVLFWKEVLSDISSFKDNFYLSGAASNLSEEEMNEYSEAGFTSISDSSLVRPLRDAYSKTDVSASALLNSYGHSTSGLREAFFDNQNTDRYTREMVNNNTYPVTRWKVALSFLYTQPEIPVVYYATEIAVNGGESPDNTPMMNFRTDKEIIDYIADLGRVRNHQKALTRGTMELLYEKDGMTVFKRQFNSEIVVVAINNTSADQSVTLHEDKLESNKELRGLLGTDLVRVDNNGNYKIAIERESAEIYKLTEKSGYNIPFILSIFVVFAAFILFMYITWKRGKKLNPEEK
ncbi:alpha-amylase family glycosyl hydrolase [Lederbergia wuyishanensis]|uniref:Alpha-amylase n=1 Tax=Lederbergia wuyishanensis TaxID=1347903 RepID=A0ABU0CYX5_9BACI|nr:alpha-amylase family glycosyl hydrolase [Lederbergia wuyishanensis]MCJ8005981.1 alpha-amylase family glycosyl hydrolase [Lederbergia wuyishanensis]MDQ0341346.1 alpha-amylase [Lederbergia wuyishanensis]